MTTDRLTRIRQELNARFLYAADARWLLAELDRVTGERDRLFRLAVLSGLSITRTTTDTIDRILLDCQSGPEPTGQIAAALAEHDRKAREEKP